MSGSPILAIQDNRPAIIGVHVAGLDRPAPLPRCGVGSWPAINYGTFMPEKLSEAAIGADVTVLNAILISKKAPAVSH